MLKLELANELSELSKLTAALERFAMERQLSLATLNDLNLVLEEIFVNIVMHGSSERQAIVIELESENGSITTRIADNGSYFNPLTYFPADNAASLDKLRIGGLGIYLVRQLNDAATYERTGGQNIMTIKLNTHSRHISSRAAWHNA